MFKCSNVKCQISNVRMFKCSNAQMFKHPNVPIFNVPMFQWSNIPIIGIIGIGCLNVQLFKCSNVQMLNVKCNMSIRLNFCRSVLPEFLWSFLFLGPDNICNYYQAGAETLKFDSLSPASPIINLKSDPADWHRQSAPLKYWSICLVKLDYILFIIFASNLILLLKKCPFFWILTLWHLQRKHFGDFDGLEISCSNLMYAKYFSEFEYSLERNWWVSTEKPNSKKRLQ